MPYTLPAVVSIKSMYSFSKTWRFSIHQWRQSGCIWKLVNFPLTECLLKRDKLNSECQYVDVEWYLVCQCQHLEWIQCHAAIDQSKTDNLPIWNWQPTLLLDFRPFLINLSKVYPCTDGKGTISVAIVIDSATLSIFKLDCR